MIYWQADFDPEGASEDEAKKKITTILGDGVKGMVEDCLRCVPAAKHALVPMLLVMPNEVAQMSVDEMTVGRPDGGFPVVKALVFSYDVFL